MSISDHAVAWFVRLHGELAVAERYEFLQWLKTSPVHIAEFLRVCRMYSWLRVTRLELPVANEDSYENVIELISRERRTAVRSAPRVSPWRTRIAAALAALGLALLLGVVVKASWFDHQIVTQASEWRNLRLADGSLLSLGPRTRVRSQFGDEQRVVHLSHGELLVQVAKDAQRPFIVDAGVARVRATGTQFAVDRQGNHVVVTVAEGSVEVTSTQREPAPVPLTAGEQVALQSDQQLPVRQVDVGRELAWVNRQLIVFETETMIDAAAQFNRRNRVQIVTDPALYGVPVRGGFHADEPETFVESMAGRMGATVVRQGPRLLRLEPAAARP